VQTLTGPVVDRRAEREREAAAWAAARAGLKEATDRFAHLGAWWQEWCRAGGLKRAARAEATRIGVPFSPAVGADLVRRLDAVFAHLPASAEPLAVLAQRVEGDAHGLDADRPLGRLAATVVAAAFGGAGAGSPDPGVRNAEYSPREAWASAGVVMSNVASTVLCLGVPGARQAGLPASAHDRGATPTSRPASAHDAALTGAPAGGADAATAIALEAMRVARMPMLLTLDQVRSGGVPALAPDQVIHVCENPTVVEVVAARWAQDAAAARAVASQASAAQARPATRVQGDPSVSGSVLVCTAGHPSTAVVELLRRLTAAGASLPLSRRLRLARIADRPGAGRLGGLGALAVPRR